MAASDVRHLGDPNRVLKAITPVDLGHRDRSSQAPAGTWRTGVSCHLDRGRRAKRALCVPRASAATRCPMVAIVLTMSVSGGQHTVNRPHGTRM